MHIHGNSRDFEVRSISAAAATEDAAARQRAADVRRKLMKSASNIEGISSPEEAFLVGQWMGSRHSQTMSEDQVSDR
jgi:predicted NBD/HSP70 family sugar kinase